MLLLTLVRQLPSRKDSFSREGQASKSKIVKISSLGAQTITSNKYKVFDISGDVSKNFKSTRFSHYARIFFIDSSKHM